MEKRRAANQPKAPTMFARYDRHWTPVHIDFDVDDFHGFLAKAVNAGAIIEGKYEMAGRPLIAFCSDPFGNGFCVIGPSS
ncbi:MAG: VOC family protein [Rhizomicrobium sp.]